MFGFFRKKSRNDVSPETGKPAAAPEPPKPAAKSEEEIMNSVSDAIKQAFRTGDADAIVKTLRDAYEAHRESEGPAGWIAGVIGEKGVVPLFGVLEDFVDRFPASLYSVRVQWADFLASQERFDEASEQARIFLRIASDADKLRQLGSLRIIRDGVSRAIAILMPAYAVLGAKSYAKRLLRFGLTLDVEAGWKAEYEHQLAALDAALEDPEEKALDAKWEAFFESASHFTELLTLCGERGFPAMADRVELIEGAFRFRPGFKVDADEMFLLVRQVETPDGRSAKALL